MTPIIARQRAQSGYTEAEREVCLPIVSPYSNLSYFHPSKENYAEEFNPLNHFSQQSPWKASHFQDQWRAVARPIPLTDTPALLITPKLTTNSRRLQKTLSRNCYLSPPKFNKHVAA